MDQQPSKDASKARFLRKHYQEGGYDEEEEQEDKNFKEDFQKALRNHSKKALTKDVEQQIEYFGYKMEAFNMKQEEEMGDIDQDGFFVFKNKRRNRDPWLDSLDQEGEEVVDRLRKKIKLQQREMTVYDADRKVQESYESEKEENQENRQEDEAGLQEEIQQQDNKLSPQEIKMLLSELLPFGSSANQYLKKLKKEKDTELYDKILFLCNEYIAATGEHDILTLKKQDLQEQQGNPSEDEEPINNWDNSSEEQNPTQMKPKHSNRKQDDKDEDEDNIF